MNLGQKLRQASEGFINDLITSEEFQENWERVAEGCLRAAKSGKNHYICSFRELFPKQDASKNCEENLPALQKFCKTQEMKVELFSNGMYRFT